MRKIICVLLMIMFISFVSADDIYSDRLNIPTLSQVNHNQTIILDASSNVTVIVPSNMTLVNYTAGGSVNGSNLSWTSVTSVYYTLYNDINLTEGDILESQVYVDGVLFDTFIFPIVPDSKVANCKSELGHGDNNWLDTSYLPAETDISLFTLARVFVLSSYFNEDASNGSVTCVFPRFHVLVSQGNPGTNITYNTNNISARFYWNDLGGNWFRVAPFEQEITAQIDGDTYDVVCGNLEYYYADGRIVAPMNCSSFEFDDSTPIDFSLSGKVVTLTNIGSYDIHEVEINMHYDDSRFSVWEVQKIESGESYKVTIDRDGTLSVRFISDWYIKSSAPTKTKQNYAVSGITIPNTGPGNNPITGRVVDVVEPISIDLIPDCMFLGVDFSFIGICWYWWASIGAILILMILYIKKRDTIWNILKRKADELEEDDENSMILE